VGIINKLGREIPEEANGKKLIPFKGAFSRKPQEKTVGRKIPIPKKPHEKKLLKSIREAIEKCGVKNGAHISFHHHLRDGDYVVNMVMEEIKRMGIKDVVLFPSALFPVHKPLVEMIEKGIIRRIEGSMNGPVGDACSHGKFHDICILRSHGGRVRAIKAGDIHIDCAFIAASAADEFGNATGVFGKSRFGPLGFSLVDSQYADKVVIITDNLVPYPCHPFTIESTNADYVVEVDSIGDPNKIVSGTTRITRSPTRLKIAEYAVRFLDEAGIISDGFSFQTGAGGISLAATKFIGDIMRERGIKASFVLGGVTKLIVDLLNEGLINVLLDGQLFDEAACDSLLNDSNHIEVSVELSYDIHSKGCIANMIDVAFLGATEVDFDFNVNVNTHSDGLLLHGIGGHQDAAAGAGITMITVPSFRNRLPILKEKVTTVTTPGETIDVVVTEMGIAINPGRKDLIKKMKNSTLPIMSIKDIYKKIIDITGKPAEPAFKDRVIALIEYRDGTIIDAVREVSE